MITCTSLVLDLVVVRTPLLCHRQAVPAKKKARRSTDHVAAQLVVLAFFGTISILLSTPAGREARRTNCKPTMPQLGGLRSLLDRGKDFFDLPGV